MKAEDKQFGSFIDMASDDPLGIVNAAERISTLKNYVSLCLDKQNTETVSTTWPTKATNEHGIL